MVNGYEFSKIKTKKLPESWKEKGALEDLEKFLQENWKQRSIFYLDGHVTSRQQFIDFDKRDGVKLQNYIGTIIFKGEQLNIFPKIFKEDEDDFDSESLELRELINNLVFWLSYCDRLNFPFVSMKNELSNTENLMELFITIYVHYVKSAIDRQRFFRYEEISETGTYVKGKINVGNYIKNKYPSGQMNKMDYTYSNFVFDNNLNRIIKCTCIFLLNMTNQPGNKKIIRNLLVKLGDITTINCTPYDCDKIHLSALHANYRIILSMSKMFLLNKVNSNSIGNTETFCFLFPAEVLFEGFVGGFMKEIFADKALVRTQTSDQYLAELVVDGEIIGNAFQLKEDIIIEYDGNIVVLDTKYKEIDRFIRVKENKKLKVSDSDMKQMAIYAAKRGAKKLFLIYPLHLNEEPETMEIRFDIRLGTKKDSVCIPLEILKIPFALDKSESETKTLMKSILNKVIS